MTTSSTSQPATSELESALARLSRVDGLADDVRACLGIDPGGDLSPAGVEAFHLDPSDVLSIYLVTRGALTIHQRTTDGQTLTVTVPLARISRTALGSAAGRTSLTLELDADQVTTEAEAEYLDQPAADEGQRHGRQVSRAVARRAGYTLVAEDDAAVARLLTFHRRLQAALHRG